MSAEVVKFERSVDIAEVRELGGIMASCGFFRDIREASQACVKILAGRELGIPPVAAMMGIHVIQGKIVMGANIIAAQIRKHGYDYRVPMITDEGCIIKFLGKAKPDGSREEIGESSFLKADAERAKCLGKDNWRNFPRNMYFARAISNGQRWYCPEVTNGNPVYTPDELGLEVNAEGEVAGKVIRKNLKDEGREAQEAVRDKKLVEMRGNAADLPDGHEASVGTEDLGPATEDDLPPTEPATPRKTASQTATGKPKPHTKDEIKQAEEFGRWKTKVGEKMYYSLRADMEPLKGWLPQPKDRKEFLDRLSRYQKAIAGGGRLHDHPYLGPLLAHRVYHAAAVKAHDDGFKGLDYPAIDGQVQTALDNGIHPDDIPVAFEREAKLIKEAHAKE